uniref:Uncharacterized protein n=1 Tax=Zosterops lateralis melanops TaxID=1220523 RepID=A0A8D2Q292_ZOSLA
MQLNRKIKPERTSIQTLLLVPHISIYTKKTILLIFLTLKKFTSLKDYLCSGNTRIVTVIWYGTPNTSENTLERVLR